VLCPCGHSLASHVRNGCKNNCGCRRDQDRALNAAIDRAAQEGMNAQTVRATNGETRHRPPGKPQTEAGSIGAER
jgi:hypothetical protein